MKYRKKHARKEEKRGQEVEKMQEGIKSQTKKHKGVRKCDFQAYTSRDISLFLSMTVNFMCQLDQTIGCPDIWSNTTLGVSGKAFRDEIAI